MSIFKKTIAAMLCGAMLLCTACGSTAETTTETSAETTAETTAASAETSEVTTAETTEETTDTSAEAVEETAETSAETSAETAETSAETSAKTAETTANTTETAKESESSMTDESTEKKLIALTFDDGPNTTTTNQVLDVLEKYNIVASFFLIGNNINDESAKSVKRAYDMGCDIENHSKSHSYMTELTAEEIKEEIEYTDNKVFEITGEYPKFFRPPYISVNKTMFENIDEEFIAGYGANDWDDRVTAENRHRRIMKQVKDGAIILLHDAEGNSLTVDALDMIIPDLLEQGYEFVTISQLFEQKNVELGRDVIFSYADQTSMYAQ